VRGPRECNSIMHWTLLNCATLAALSMMTACASESQITAPRAYAPTERLDDLANEETAKRRARERVHAENNSLSKTTQSRQVALRLKHASRDDVIGSGNDIVVRRG
jgi:hypothetical protein